MQKRAKFLKNFSLTLVAFAFASAFAFAKSDAKNEERRGYIGVTFYSNGKINKVLPGTAAKKAGLKDGDRIITINSVSTEFMDKEQLAERVSGPEGTKVYLGIERSGKRFACALTRSLSQKTLLENAGLTEIPKQKNDSKEPEKISPPVLIGKRSKDTDYIEKSVLKGLSKIPKPIRDKLANSGLKIQIVSSLIDADPGLRGGRPSGYTHGGGWDNCPGRYDDTRKTIFIGERNGWRNQPMALNQGAEGITIHEMGHAFDDQNYCSTSEDFKKAYGEDTKSLTNETRLIYQVYLQEGAAGPAEMFAELFHCSFSNETSHRGMDQAKAFPRCYAYVQKRTGKYTY